LGFSSAVATYLTGTCGINSLDEIAYLDGIDYVDTTTKGVMNPGGMVTTGLGVTSVTLRNNGIPVPIRAVANLKLCVYYLKHTERVQRCQLNQLGFGLQLSQPTTAWSQFQEDSKGASDK
jgi:hypothetical protein